MEGAKHNTHYPQPESLEHKELMSQRREALRAEIDEMLPEDAHFVWEVGCGHGHFLTAYSAAHPAQICVGVDTKLDRVRRGERKRNRAELETLHFVRTEARLFLEVLSPRMRFDAIYILFPDPWPKKRHHKNRIMKPEFLADLAKRCDSGTPLYFRTDFDPYFDEVTETVKAHPDWTLQKESPWPFELETVFQKRAPSYQSLVALRK
jgi:tRNA (guanine-N7-)-methyltransferase